MPPAAPSPVALELDDLRCVRGTRVLFDGVRAAVPAGHLLRVHGENGSGKTSLLRIVCGLSSPDAGTLRWHGEDTHRLHAQFHAQLVYLGHAPALKDALSAVENLQAACALSGLACSAADAQGALAQAGLRGRMQLPARALSQGQRKRVALARLALSAALPLWVLDEPFNALDAEACAWVQGLLQAHLARGGVVVLTSHVTSAWDSALPQVALTLRSPTPAVRLAQVPQVPITAAAPQTTGAWH